jgi:sugar O-acyltransferase (sialic acid O-acetyltransferase NeuD family)
MGEIKRPCIIWGGTGQAKVAYDILLEEGVQVIHFFENNASVASPLANIPISYGLEGFLFFVDALKDNQLNPSDVDCVAAIGGGNGEAREGMTKLMESHGFKPRSLIHKSAIISPFASIGDRVQVLAGSIIGAFASVGDYSIINSGANVDHDCKIGKNCHLAPRAALAGEITIEDNVYVGTNATILPRLRICAGAMIGAGAVVTKDVSVGAVVVGNPARPLVKWPNQTKNSLNQ